MWANGSLGLPSVTRRDALKSLACAFGYLAFAGLAGAKSTEQRVVKEILA